MWKDFALIDTIEGGLYEVLKADYPVLHPRYGDRMVQYCLSSIDGGSYVGHFDTWESVLKFFKYNLRYTITDIAKEE